MNTPTILYVPICDGCGLPGVPGTSRASVAHQDMCMMCLPTMKMRIVKYRLDTPKQRRSKGHK